MWFENDTNTTLTESINTYFLHMKLHHTAVKSVTSRRLIFTFQAKRRRRVRLNAAERWERLEQTTLQNPTSYDTIKN